MTTDSPEHESLCQRCGISCHASVKLESGENAVVEHLHCKHLTENGCSVYENRLEVAPWCHHVSRAEPLNLLRHDCPYTLRDRGGNSNMNGKRQLSDSEYRARFLEIAEELLKIVNGNVNFSYEKFIEHAQEMDPEYIWFVRKDVSGSSLRFCREPMSWKSQARAMFFGLFPRL